MTRQEKSLARAGARVDAGNGRRRVEDHAATRISILIAQKCRVVTKFRNTIGLKGRLSTRLQPNHPTDDPPGIAASIVDGLMYGNGDAVIGINPATDSIAAVTTLIKMLNEIIARYNIPTQSCMLTHVTTQHRGDQSRRARRSRVPVDRRNRSRQ